jgi:hydrophobic/amphiphilic exporter-1 (mainly G- bacteria), HAE1 family
MSLGPGDGGTDLAGRGRAEALGAFGFVTTRPVAITMFMLGIAVFGLVSLGKLPVDLLPEISYPTVTVRTVYEGAAPEDVEDRISERVQEALSTLSHLVRSTSISRAETSDVLLEFDWGTSMTFALQDVRDKLDGVFLPDGAERPLILRYDPNLDPILRIGMTSAKAQGLATPEEELIHLRWLAENSIKRELEALSGVAAVLVRGGLEEEIRVRVDPFKMAAQQLDPALLGIRLAQENINASGGLIREGSTEYLVRTLNEFRTVEEIADLALARRGEATIRVRDVAEVERTHTERDVISSIDGREAVEIAVYREADANIVALAESVKLAVFGTEQARAFTDQLKAEGRDKTTTVGERAQADYLAWRLRDQARFETLSDQSIFIASAVREVRDAAVIGALLAVLVLWVFLRSLPPTLIIGLTVPITVLATFSPMYMLDVSLNIMSLGGLALGVGMLLDNSIVVLESVERCRADGESYVRGAVRGTREVAAAMTASTLTTVSVFLPIVFVTGIVGQIFGDQAITVVTSQLVSLFVGIIFIPMLASRSWFDPARRRSAPERPPGPPRGAAWREKGIIAGVLGWIGHGLVVWFGWKVRFLAGLLWLLWRVLQVLLLPLGWAFDVVWSRVERHYPRLLAWALDRPLTVLGSALLLFGLCLLRVPHLGLDLLPEVHQGEFTALVTLDLGSPLAQTEAVLGEVEREVRALPAVAGTSLTVGVEKDTLTREIEGKHTGRLTVRLAPEHANAATEEATVLATREILARRPEVKAVDVSRPTPFSISAPVTVEILGHDLALIDEVGREVHAALVDMPGLADVRTTLRPGHPEVLVVFDRDKTLEYGLDLAAVSALVRDQVLGNVSTRFNEGEDRIDVRVIGDEVVLSRLDRIRDLVVNPNSEKQVELGSVAEFHHVQGPAEIRRIGNARAVVVTATGQGLDLGGLSKSIEERLSGLTTPDEVSVQLGGQKQELEDARRSMVLALALALFLVYVVMACQFESLVQPLIIMLTAPMGVIGVVLVLDLLSIPLSVVVFLGLVLLAGIVVNNAIVLVDRINQKRAEGLSSRDAILDAGSTRLRPIMMTTMTTVIGLLPMTGWFDGLPGLSALSSGEGAELRTPMAITVIGGISVATLLTLIVIPAAYHVVCSRQDRRVRGTPVPA